MRYLTLPELFDLHRRLIVQTGGAAGVRDLGRLEAALAQPRMTFDGADLYPSLFEKVVALGFTLIMNHPFMDGNKRVGHAAMATSKTMAFLGDARSSTLHQAPSCSLASGSPSSVSERSRTTKHVHGSRTLLRTT